MYKNGWLHQLQFREAKKTLQVKSKQTKNSTDLIQSFSGCEIRRKSVAQMCEAVAITAAKDITATY